MKPDPGSIILTSAALRLALRNPVSGQEAEDVLACCGGDAAVAEQVIKAALSLGKSPRQVANIMRATGATAVSQLPGFVLYTDGSEQQDSSQAPATEADVVRLGEELARLNARYKE